MFLSSPNDGHSNCFQFWVLIHYAPKNICVLVTCFHFSRHGIAESSDKFTLNFSRNGQTVLQRSCITLHPHQQRIRVPMSPPPQTHYCLLLNGCLSSGREMCLYFYVTLFNPRNHEDGSSRNPYPSYHISKQSHAFLLINRVYFLFAQ